MNIRSEVHHANHYTIEASYKKGQIFHAESYNEWSLVVIQSDKNVTTDSHLINAFSLSNCFCDNLMNKFV